jgi:hypothetical protein
MPKPTSRRCGRSTASANNWRTITARSRSRPNHIGSKKASSTLACGNGSTLRGEGLSWPRTSTLFPVFLTPTAHAFCAKTSAADRGSKARHPGDRTCTVPILVTLAVHYQARSFFLFDFTTPFIPSYITTTRLIIYLSLLIHGLVAWHIIH